MRVIFPSNHETALPLQPGINPFHQPASFKTTPHASILCFQFPTITHMRRNHFDTDFTQIFIQWVTILRTITEQVICISLHRVKVNAQLRQDDFIVPHGVCDARQWQTMPDNYRLGIYAIPGLSFADVVNATLGRSKRGINKSFPIIQYTLIAQGVLQDNQNIAHNVITESLLKAAMHRFVMGITMRQHVLSRASV